MGLVLRAGASYRRGQSPDRGYVKNPKYHTSK